MSQFEQVAAFALPRSEDANSAFSDLDVAVSLRRSFAGLFDLAILGVVLVSLFRNYGLTAHRWIITLPLHNHWSFVPKYWVFSLMYLKPPALALFVVVAVSYFTVFESAFGWTPGKLVFAIRVVDFYGDTPTVGQALTRNLFRLLDAYPFVVPNLVGIAIVMTNRRRQRGGDKAAGTLVVDKGAATAVRSVRDWQRRKAAAEITLPEEVWT